MTEKFEFISQPYNKMNNTDTTKPTSAVQDLKKIDAALCNLIALIAHQTVVELYLVHPEQLPQH